MTTGVLRRTTTTALTLTMAGTLGLGLMAPGANAANGPCYDGRCKTTVSKGRTIKVSSKKFGFGTLKVAGVSPSRVTFWARWSGGYSEASTSGSGNGTVQFNNLKIWVKSVSGGKAKIQLFPTKY
ncbi:hypothetical protein [Streptomyces capitiformicae]|uniref:Uncharacterized protein n=1 Tax=Streptomyces capitiformicae TaxID=2014920 RepID=A0A919GBX3_9ACTN|nr:hypothetical protein [Streptomyces capitiformicae]GHH81181.1 hypothetical protein GCM10017771_02390 [Streptomyces capitiformicae]